MTFARLMPVALATAALLASGCGSSSGGDGSQASPAKAAQAGTPAAKPAGPPPSKAEYVRRADRLCTEARDVGQRANAQVRKAYAARQTAQAAATIERFAPTFAAKVQQFQDLQRPRSASKVLDDLMTVMYAQVKAVYASSRALRAGDSAGLQRVASAQQEAAKLADGLGRRYGFKVCGRVG